MYSLVAINTREGAVLQRILSKLDVMREQMGTDRVYDVIDELLEEVPLLRLLEQSIDGESGTQAASETEQCLSSGLEQRQRRSSPYRRSNHSHRGSICGRHASCVMIPMSAVCSHASLNDFSIRHIVRRAAR